MERLTFSYRFLCNLESKLLFQNPDQPLMAFISTFSFKSSAAAATCCCSTQRLKQQQMETMGYWCLCWTEISKKHKTATQSGQNFRLLLSFALVFTVQELLFYVTNHQQFLKKSQNASVAVQTTSLLHVSEILRDITTANVAMEVMLTSLS